jgi:predicted phosphodiesterase
MKRTFLTAISLFTLLAAQAAVVNVSPGTGTLKSALASATAGDVLVLSDGTYTESGTMRSTVPVTVKAAAGATPVIQASARFEAKQSLTLDGLTIVDASKDGHEGVRMLYEDGISSTNMVMNIRNCTFSNTNGYAVRVYTSSQTYVDSLNITGCQFINPAKRVVYAMPSSGDAMMLRYVSIKNSTFSITDGHEQDSGQYTIYIGNTDGASTDIPRIDADHLTFYNLNVSRVFYAAMVNNTHMTNCIFATPVTGNSFKSAAMYPADENPNCEMHNCISYNYALYLHGATQSDISSKDPLFVDAPNGNFQLFANSPAVGTATDGSNLGDPRWGVSTKMGDEPFSLVKKPYSMSPTTSSVRILWQTASSNPKGYVYYGTSPDQLTDTLYSEGGWNVKGEGYEHVVELTGLKPFTQYYYKVGDGKTSSDDVRLCKTAPEAGIPWRMYIISDLHENDHNIWQNQQDLIVGTVKPDLGMFIGDFVNEGWERDWSPTFFTPGDKFISNITFSSAVGNHETYMPDDVDSTFVNYHTFYDYFSFQNHGTSEGPIIDPRGEAYFTFPYGDAQIICLNLNNEGDDVNDSPKFDTDSRQYKWLENQLATSTSKWILIFNHVGITTTGYHGQWSEEVKTYIRPLLEKYAKLQKHIIVFAGDDHSFEHAQKDGVNYVRPGCGRDSNYPQQTQLPDMAYSLIYRQVSCFSTLDMAADGKSIILNAYDSIGNPIYNYEFSLSAKQLPNLYISLPSKVDEVQTDSVLVTFSSNSVSAADVKLYYTTDPALKGGTLMTQLTAAPNGMHHFYWNVRHLEPRGKYYVYGTTTNADTTLTRAAYGYVLVARDSLAPLAPDSLQGKVMSAKSVRLSWKNPTHLINMNTTLSDFEDGMGKFQAVEANDEGSAVVTEAAGHESAKSASVAYSVTKEWGQGAAAYVFDQATDLTSTPTLDFWYKGDGSKNMLRMVLYTDENGDNVVDDSSDDWWYNETLSLSSTEWQHATLYMGGFEAFTWKANVLPSVSLKKVKSIDFIVPSSATCSGTIYIDDVHILGQVNPSPDFSGTRILRSINGYPRNVNDGEVIYDGKAETFTDNYVKTGVTYYYSAFSHDDLDNISPYSEHAIWKLAGTATGITAPQATPSVPQEVYTLSGQRITTPRAPGLYIVNGKKVAKK